MVGGSFFYKADRMKKKEHQKLVDERKAQEKREKWIKELEARDAEDRAWREKLGKVQKLQREEEEDMKLLENARKKRTEANADEQQVRKNMLKEKTKKKPAKEATRERNQLERPRASAPEPVAVKKDDKPRYESVLGEREQGGLLGHKYLIGFYENKVKPAFGKSSESEGDKSDTSAGQDPGRKE